MVEEKNLSQLNVVESEPRQEGPPSPGAVADISGYHSMAFLFCPCVRFQKSGEPIKAGRYVRPQTGVVGCCRHVMLGRFPR